MPRKIPRHARRVTPARCWRMSCSGVRREDRPGSTVGHVHEFVLTRSDAFADPLRKHAMHQTARTPCRATAGHIRTPTSLTPAAAFARTAPAAQLYSSIAATNPRRVRVGPSSRASQQAPPNESNAAPAMRPTINAAGASSDTPSNNPATSDGDTSRSTPTPVSAKAVTVSSVLDSMNSRPACPVNPFQLKGHGHVRSAS